MKHRQKIGLNLSAVINGSRDFGRIGLEPLETLTKSTCINFLISSDCSKCYILVTKLKHFSEVVWLIQFLFLKKDLFENSFPEKDFAKTFQKVAK